jgi:hypothetical protein
LTKKLADVLMGHADHRLKTETSKVAGKKSRASSRFFIMDKIPFVLLLAHPIGKQSVWLNFLTHSHDVLLSREIRVHPLFS